MMARTNKSQYALLGMLSKRPMSGYDIKSIMERMAGFYWSEGNAQIYPLLKQLEQQGAVTSKIDHHSGKRERRVYRITEKGMQQLTTWLQSPPSPQPHRNELLLKLSYGQHLETSTLKKHLEDFLHHIEKKKFKLQQAQAHINEAHEHRLDQPYLHLTYHYVEHQLNAEEQWCQDALSALESMH